jgi:histidinol-phosphate aminotransferase
MPVVDAAAATAADVLDAAAFAVTDVAQAAGVASLAAEDELQARIDVLIAERTRVEAALADQGWHVTPSQANFTWLQLGENSEAVSAHLTSRGIIVRPFAGQGIRITIGDAEANDAVLAALADAPRG